MKNNFRTNFNNKKSYNDYKMRYSLCTPDIGISFNSKKALVRFINENAVMRGRVYDHKYRRDCATILNNNIYSK